MSTVTEDAARQMLRIGGNFVRSTTQFIEELLKILEKNKLDDPNARAIGEHVRKGGDIRVMVADDEILAKLEPHLVEQNVAFIVMDTESGGEKNKTLIIRDKDHKRAEFCMRMVFAEMGHNVEFEKNEFLNITPRKEVACLSDMDAYEYEMFREKAKNEGLVFCATKDEDGKVNILYNINDQSKLDAAVFATTWDLTGRNGDEYEAAYRTKSEAQEMIQKAHLKKAEPCIMVDAAHPERVIIIKKDEVSFCDNYDDAFSMEANIANAKTIKHKDKNYMSEIGAMYNSMVTPVIVKHIFSRKEEIKEKLPKVDKEWEEKEAPYKEKFTEDARANAAKIKESFNQESYPYAKVQHKKDLSKEDLKEIDEHTKNAYDKACKYQIYCPNEKEKRRDKGYNKRKEHEER